MEKGVHGFTVKLGFPTNNHMIKSIDHVCLQRREVAKYESVTFTIVCQFELTSMT